ncbi:hypothetical protein LSH36_562g00042 [Paralvinella palmiformis]|uniref:Serine/threonine-protein phosphatase n=1 Tax=Paralvinella palmiformis TaxID=53620 RepID=A0AAD9MVR9_9ANNE|nr:hypothetical protein LSH36_562g00042 [Paralvinella palmiformis]
MGCGTSTIVPANEPSAQKTMKAALLIQMWYRRYLARLEARRRYTWNIFQSLEYADEQDQLRLYNFFNDMISQLHLSSENSDDNQQNSLLSLLRMPSRPDTEMKNGEDEDANLYKHTDPQTIVVPMTYKGPRLDYPLKLDHVQCLIDAFKGRQVLHAHYLLELLHETRRILKMNSIISHVHTRISQQVTVVGDLHGKLDDLLIIFYKNGLPEARNPYVFNGDFVDRGPNSVEVAVLLFACLLVNPLSVYINRGNHEDHVMNLRYGFIKEIMTKYKGHATKLIRLFGDVFSWLPMATVIDDKILVCHGGISNRTDLDYLKTIDRHKYISILRPPTSSRDGYDSDDSDYNDDITEWQQVLDLLWSDPRPTCGCSMNTFRGGGSYFGPDVTKSFLAKHGLELLIRSHECKPEGYEFDHDNQVLTVFSASNYYEVGSNRGAYVKLGANLKPRIVQYMATKQAGRKLTIKQRVSYVEASALRSLREKLYASKTILLEEFQKRDPDNTGKLLS